MPPSRSEPIAQIVRGVNQNLKLMTTISARLGDQKAMILPQRGTNKKNNDRGRHWPTACRHSARERQRNRKRSASAFLWQSCRSRNLERVLAHTEDKRYMSWWDDVTRQNVLNFDATSTCVAQGSWSCWHFQGGAEDTANHANDSQASGSENP